MKILQLAPQFPFPEDDGGRISISNTLRYLSESGAEITFFCFIEEEPDRKLIEKAEKFCSPILFKHSTKNSINRIFKSLVFNSPIYLDKHINQRIKQKLKTVVKSFEPDIIHCDHTCMAPLGYYLKKKFNIPYALRLHNIEWIIWKRYADILEKFNPKYYYINHQAYILKNLESKYIKNADINFTITNIDKSKALDMAPGAKVLAVPAGVDNEYWKPNIDSKRNSNQLIIATNYNWVHNVDGIKWFITKVLSKVRNFNPEIELLLIGKNPPEWLKSYENLGVRVVGYVNDIRPFLSSAGIYIVPLFVGSGIRIKILEAMAMCLPVVATSVAAEGIEANQDNGLFIENSPDNFANRIIGLSNDKDKLYRLGLEARKKIEERYLWKNNIRLIFDEYQSIIK